MLLNIKCPQLSKPKAKATVARNQNSIRLQNREKNLDSRRNYTQSGASFPLANEGTVYDSGSITSQIGSEHLKYLSISICLEVKVIMPVWRRVVEDQCR